MEPISMKFLHVVERNVICHLLLLKLIMQTGSSAITWSTSYKFSSNSKMNHANYVNFFIVILLQSGYSGSAITKSFVAKRGFKLDHYWIRLKKSNILMTLYKAVYFDQWLLIFALKLKCSYSLKFAHAETFKKNDQSTRRIQE